MALSTSTTARWTILSSSEAIPSGRCRPSAFGMYTLREGFARYAPRRSRSCRSRRFSSRSTPYCSHVTPSTPAAACFFSCPNAVRSRSVVMWWKSAVNFASLSLLAACRTRASALGALVRLCVRDAFCWLVFSLARPLPSIPSAAACAALFGDFVGTTGLSDSPRPSSSASGLRPSRCGPPFHRAWAVEGSPGSRAERFRSCWGLRPRGVD